MRRRQAFDHEALPVLYLFRHYVELMLKGCIVNARVLAYGLGKEYNDRALGSHNLRRLASVLRSLWEIQKVRATLSNIVGQPTFFSPKSLKFLSELDHIDPDSSRLRYPTTKTGASSLPLTFSFEPTVFEWGMDHLQKELAKVFGQLEMTVFATDELLIEFQKRMASSWPK